MRKHKNLLSFLLIMSLLLTACGGAGTAPAQAGQDAAAEAAAGEAGAEESEEVFKPVIPDEPYAAVEYSLYPSPEGGYVGDVMPYVTDDGELELYYLYDTDINGQGYHPIYKYSTQDLSGFEDHGMVLDYGKMSDPDPALGTGSVMQDPSGLYHLFYTGHNDTGNGGKGKECVMHATSTDRENWEKDESPLFFAPEGYSKDDFRDPEVFWVDKDQCYWLLIAANENTLGGVVLKYTSRNLKNWEFIGPIFAPLKQYMCECPDLFQIGDYWYLTYSWDCVTYYAMSDSIDGDSGIYQWAGNVMNHELVQHEDGTLGVKAPEVYDNFFTADKPFKAEMAVGEGKISGNNITLTAEKDSYSVADMGTRPASMTLECDVTIDEDGCAGFAFGGSEKDASYTALCLDAKQNLLHYEGYEITDLDTMEPQALTKFDFSDLDTMEPQALTKFDFSKGGVHHVKLVCENEIVVLYVDDIKALSSRITHSIDGAHIGVFSNGCGASFENITMKLSE